MPRILYLFSHYPRWSETFLRQDLKLLQKTGLPLLPMALYPGDCPQQKDWPQVEILSSSRKAVSSSLAPAHFSLRLPPFIQQYISLYRHRQVLRYLIQIIRQKEITAIHAEFADLAALLASEAARQTGISYSLSIHAFDVHAGKFPLNTIYGRAEKIIVCNQEAQNALIAQEPELKNKICKIYHGLILQEWPFRPHSSFPAGKILKILFVGRFVPKKGLSLLLQGLAAARRQNIRCTLDLIGEGPCETGLRQLAEELHITEQITWHGRISRSRIPDFMAQADLFFMPSIVTADKNQDGIPNVVVEAMAAGLPVMGSQAGSLYEILSEQTGWPIPVLTPENICRALQHFLADPDCIPTRIQAARQMVEQKFNAEKLALEKKLLFLTVSQKDSPPVIR